MRITLLLCVLFVSVSACAAGPDEHTAEIHRDHAHVHGEQCGHLKVWHVDHWDYLHDGHLHAIHDGHIDEHFIEITDENPAGEAPLPASAHADHMHGPSDSHAMIRHGDHMDYIHDGRLHHVHGDHVDDHGPITIEKNG